MKDCVIIDGFTITPEMMEVLKYWFNDDNQRSTMLSLNDDPISSFMDTIQEVNNYMIDVADDDQEDSHRIIGFIRTMKDLYLDIRKMHSSKISRDIELKVMEEIV